MDSHPGEKTSNTLRYGPPYGKASNGDNIANASIADSQKRWENLLDGNQEVDNVRGLL